MLHTTKLLSARFPTGIELIIIGYVQAKKRDWKHVANAGEYETCLNIPPKTIGTMVYTVRAVADILN